MVRSRNIKICYKSKQFNYTRTSCSLMQYARYVLCRGWFFNPFKRIGKLIKNKLLDSEARASCSAAGWWPTQPGRFQRCLNGQGLVVQRTFRV